MRTAIIEYKYYKEDPRKATCLIDDDIYNNSHQRILISNHPAEKNTNYNIFLNHSNKGKDIGAKLLGIDYLMATDSKIDTLILIHDKRSPHSPLGNYWLNELTKIFREPYWMEVKKQMAKKEIGICCSANYVKSEYNQRSKKFAGTNDLLLQNLIQEYNLQPAYPYFFVAGTIFCCKWQPVYDFFSKVSPLKIRESLENGNVQDIEKGTYTHSWERIFSWIITSQGYKIKGL